MQELLAFLASLSVFLLTTFHVILLLQVCAYTSIFLEAPGKIWIHTQNRERHYIIISSIVIYTCTYTSLCLSKNKNQSAIYTCTCTHIHVHMTPTNCFEYNPQSPSLQLECLTNYTCICMYALKMLLCSFRYDVY